MAETTRSTTTSRRLFLADGIVAAVCAALYGEVTSAEAASPVIALMDAHKAAWSALDVHLQSDVETDSTTPEFLRLDDEEHRTFFEICAYRPKNMTEVSVRSAYLAEHITHAPLSEEQIEALLASHC